MPLFVKATSSLIGLGTEAYAHHKEKKQNGKPPTPAQTPTESQQQLTPSSYGSQQYPPPPNSLAPPPAYPGGRQRRSNSTASNISDASAYESDEDEWARDAAQEQLVPTHSTGGQIPTVDQLVDDFTRNQPPPEYKVIGKLPYPVIIPQKRPEAKTHGFIRAYAPALNECGVDQTAFLEFLDNYSTSIREEVTSTP